MPQLDKKRLDEIKANNEIDGTLFQFAYGFNVNINVQKESTKDSLENGILYRLKIRSTSAKSLNLIFGNYKLPESANLFLYGNNADLSDGAFTKQNNKKNKQLATEPIRGDVMTVEYFEPYDVEFSEPLIINKISHGLYGTEDGNYGASGNCQVDINCAEGNVWQDEKRSVVKIIINGTGLCSGALVNNTSNDGTPYILTANHCICNQNEAQNSVYIFNYESPTCNGIDGSVTQSVSSADLRATNAASDFALLELSSIPPASYNAFYAGWDRQNNATTAGVGIHHPMGDVKKISAYNTALANSNCMNFNGNGGCGTVLYPNANFWRVNWIATVNGHSVTEGGSSGSPLFNNQSRIVGQLYGAGTCNNSNCENPNTDTANFGKLFSSWTGPNNASRLSFWLDPNNTGANTVNGMYLCTSNTSISGPNLLCSTATSYSVTGLPPGSTISWTTSGNVLRNSAQGSNPCNFSANGSGSGWIRATITNVGSCIPGFVTKNIQVGTPSASNIIMWNDTQVSYPYNTTPANTPVVFQVGYPPGDRCAILDVQWDISSSHSIFTGPMPCTPDNNSNKYIVFNSPGTVYVKSKIKNSCGWSSWSAATVMNVTSGSYMYSVYPNPSSGEFFIAPAQSVQKVSLIGQPVISSNGLEIEIYDLNGQRVMSRTFQNYDEPPKVDATILGEGMYFMKLVGREVDETHTIIIE